MVGQESTRPAGGAPGEARAPTGTARDESSAHKTTLRCDIVNRRPRVREPSAAGSWLPGGYAVRSVLGEGGMGRVYLAEQLSLRRMVAIKMPHPQSSRDESRERFRVEALATSRVRHCGSVAIYDLGEREDGVPFIVMEHVAGRRLSELRREDLPTDRVVKWGIQLLATLAEAHTCGVIHRDVKLDNIMVRRSLEDCEQTILVDYGLALIQQGKCVLGASNPGVAYGTPAFMSPEQRAGASVDARTDVYSVAVVLRMLLAGRAGIPSQSRKSEEVGDALLRSIGRCGLPAAIGRALATDPAERTPSAAAFASELAESLTVS